jgi:hypothetical protein
MVAVFNRSDAPIEVNWTDFSLLYKNKHSEMRTALAIDPGKVERGIMRRTNIASALAAFGAAMSASTPQMATVSAEGQTATIAVYPSANQVSAATHIAAERAAAPGTAKAGVVAQFSLKRTTVSPGGHAVGIVFFSKQDGSPASLQFRHAGIPTVSVSLDRE